MRPPRCDASATGWSSTRPVARLPPRRAPCGSSAVWCFHWAFLLLLIAVIAGKGTGYVGHATIVEGYGWTDARFNYDGDLRTGRFFGGNFSGTQVHLDDFQDDFRTTGIPMDFRSQLTLAAPDGTSEQAEVRINHPVVFNGIRIYQFGFGWAPIVKVAARRPGLVRRAGPARPDHAARWEPTRSALARVREAHDAAAPGRDRRWRLYPDAERLLPLAADRRAATDDRGQRAVHAVPGVAGEAPGQLPDRRSIRGSCVATSSGLIGKGWTVDATRGCVVSGTSGALPASLANVTCPNGGGPATLTMAFPELRQYTTLQISHDATVPYVLAAAILIVLGLLPALYVSRRKVWVRARPDGSGLDPAGGRVRAATQGSLR